MTGQSAVAEQLERLDPKVENTDGDIVVRTSAGVLRITNCKTPGAAKARLERLERSTGLVVAELAEQTELFAAPFRAELIALAGGDLPASVQMQAHLAVVAVATVRKAQLLSDAAVGDWSEARLDALACETLHERADKSQRNLAGLAIVARDLLQSTRAAAIATGQQTKGSATDHLMQRLGVTATAQASEVPGPVPAEGPGVMLQGAPTQQNHSPKTGTPK